MTPYQFVRRSQPHAQLPHLVLVQFLERFDDLSPRAQFSYQRSIVVMSLDHLGVSAGQLGCRFDEIGTECSHGEDGRIGTQPQTIDFAIAQFDERISDDGPFFLRIGRLSQRFGHVASNVGGGVHEKVGIAYHVEIYAGILEGNFDHLALVVTHHSVIDVYGMDGTLQFRLGHEQRRDGGVDTAADEEEDVAITDRIANFGKGRLMTILERIPGRQAGDLE
mmetsp:Transcript_41439/g.125470  ORF Transcript_41439/g.125470 Transcript_41439/m.125470 type:complete len:221 (+) Transcript_41439:707-1369(+)